MKNDTSFYEKQAVVLCKTSRRFVKNKPSFMKRKMLLFFIVSSL